MQFISSVLGIFFMIIGTASKYVRFSQFTMKE